MRTSSNHPVSIPGPVHYYHSKLSGKLPEKKRKKADQTSQGNEKLRRIDEDGR
jgi:hypothetical protein